MGDRARGDDPIGRVTVERGRQPVLGGDDPRRHREYLKVRRQRPGQPVGERHAVVHSLLSSEHRRLQQAPVGEEQDVVVVFDDGQRPGR
jgi:hypothetical protein